MTVTSARGDQVVQAVAAARAGPFPARLLRSKPFSSRKASRKPWASRPRIRADSAASQRSPRSSRRRPLRSRAKVHTVPSACSRRGVFRSPGRCAGRRRRRGGGTRPRASAPSRAARRLRAARQSATLTISRSAAQGRRARAPGRTEHVQLEPPSPTTSAGSRAAVSTASGLLPSRDRGQRAPPPPRARRLASRSIHPAAVTGVTSWRHMRSGSLAEHALGLLVEPALPAGDVPAHETHA